MQILPGYSSRISKEDGGLDSDDPTRGAQGVVCTNVFTFSGERVSC